MTTKVTYCQCAPPKWQSDSVYNRNRQNKNVNSPSTYLANFPYMEYLCGFELIVYKQIQNINFANEATNVSLFLHKVKIDLWSHATLILSLCAMLDSIYLSGLWSLVLVSLE
jgi:hypothetical protein